MRHLNRRIFQFRHEKNNENDETSNNVNEKEEERNSTALLGGIFDKKVRVTKLMNGTELNCF